MPSENEVGKIEYHYGFYGAVHVVYEPTKVHMEYLQEHELGDEPVRMDMLILKHDRPPLSDPIGRFFRTNNVLEYKSPRDSLSIDEFYKAQGYALLYKGMGRSVNAIPLEELTVSLFRHSYPERMFEMLREQGLMVTEEYPGVYRVSGAISVPAQVIVTSRLPRGEYGAFRALSKDADKEDIANLLQLADEDAEPGMIGYIRAVLNVSAAVNEELFDEIKEAGDMSEALKRVFKDEFERERLEGKDEGILSSLKNLMSNMNLTLQQAMDALGIPAADRPKYMAKF